MPLSERRELEIRRRIGQPEISPRDELQLRKELAGQAPANPLIDVPLRIMQGINRGLLDVVGAPVDVANAALGLVGLGSERPVGGSRQLSEDIESTTGIGFSNIEDIPEGMRPFVRGGQTVGQSIPIAAAPLAAVRAGRQGLKVLRPIMEMARTESGAFALAEAASAAGAGIGRGIAEQVAPGDETVGMLAEVAGGFVSPIALLGRGVSNANNLLGRVKSIFSRTGREVAVGQRVRGLLEGAGEDVAGVTQRLQEPETLPGARPTAGQKVDSPTLLALEKRLVREIPGLDNNIRQSTRDTTESLNKAFDLAVEAGDATLITQISRERERWFGSLMAARVAAAARQATETSQKLLPKRGRQDVSLAVRATLDSALQDARAAERALWQPIPRDVPTDPNNLNDAFPSARSELLEEEALPAPIEAFMRRVQRSLNPEDAGDEAVEAITSGDLLRFRSRVLEMQRQARSGQTPDFGLARRLGQMADGVLDDLADIPGTDKARAFSRSLNNVFTRGEVGNLLGFSPRGGARVEPELTLQQSIGGGGQRAGVASRQIEEAAQLQGLPGDLPRRTTLSEQEDFVRTLFVRAVDPATGKVNPGRLARLTRDNQELLDRFPGLKKAVSDAGTAQEMLEAAARLEGQSVKAMQQRSAFSKVAGFERPEQAIANILDGPLPLRHYREISRIAKTSGPNATAGLRRATFDVLFDRATDSSGLISGIRLRQQLQAKIGDKTLMETMVDQGILSKTQVDGLNRIIERTEIFELAIKSGQRIDDVITDVGALEDLFTRIIGANIGGTAVVGRSIGTPLIAAQAGSSTARKLAQKIPAGQAKQILAEAIENPRFMARLLSKTKSPSLQASIRRQINAFVLQTAIPGKEDARERQAPGPPIPFRPSIP